MTTQDHATPHLEPFAIGIYLQPSIASPGAKSVCDVPTPLLDPSSLQNAYAAYDAAATELRTRTRNALRPGVRHSLAKKVLGFVIFGERDRRLLKDRALAHFL